MLDSDLIQQAILRDADRYRLQSYEDFCLIISVHPGSIAKPIYNLQGVWVGYDNYDLDVTGLPLVQMKIRLDRTADVKFVHVGTWISLYEYLKLMLPMPTQDPALDTPWGQWNQQFNWWMVNGRTFRFLDLPAEIRGLIYEHAFGTEAEPFPNCKARRLGARTGAIMARMPNSKILRLNRKVYEEASNTLFLKTSFFVEHLGVLAALTSNVNLRTRVRILELALSHFDFFRLFGGLTGTSSRSDVMFTTHHMANALQKMTLNHLELTLAPPSITTGHREFDGACQKVIVDWLLNAAWPIVRGFPVRVQGFVKESQKKAFVTAGFLEQKRYERWQRMSLAAGSGGDILEYHEWVDDAEVGGGIKLDETMIVVEEDVRLMQQGPVKDLPPICRCKALCTPRTWTMED